MRLKKFIRLVDSFFLMRPTLFFPVWTVYLVGYIQASIYDDTNWFQFSLLNDFRGGDSLLFGILITLLCGGIFILNQIQDVVTDRENDKLFLIANKVVSEKWAYVEAILLISGSLFLGFWYNLTQGLIFTGLFIITGWFYSYTPFNWKNKAFPGLLTNALAGLFIFSSGWCSEKPISGAALVQAFPYVFAISTIYLYTTIPDRFGDKLANKMTYAVRFGYKTTTRWALVLGLVTLFISLVLADWMMTCATFISLIFFLKVFLTQNDKDLSLATKLPILFLALAVSWKIPGYFILILVNLYSTKIYYRFRFRLNYPKFSSLDTK